MVENISKPENYEQPYTPPSSKPVKSSTAEKVEAKTEPGPQENPEISPERKAEIAKAMEKFAREFEKTGDEEGDVMQEVLKALTNMADGLQKLGISQADEMQKKTGIQRFLTNCLNDIPFYDTERNPPPPPFDFKKDDSAQTKLDKVNQANQKWGIESQKIESRRGIQTDDQKKLQAGLSRTDDFQKQILDMMQSLMQKQSAWVQSIIQR